MLHLDFRDTQGHLFRDGESTKLEFIFLIEKGNDKILQLLSTLLIFHF
jgi:hypothetical protein